MLLLKNKKNELSIQTQKENDAIKDGCISILIESKSTILNGGNPWAEIELPKSKIKKLIAFLQKQL